MKKVLYAIFLFVFMLNIIGCETKPTVTEPVAAPEPIVERVKATIPLDDRRFIYNNGIKTEPKESQTIDDKKIINRMNYPVISGLKDKSVENKINNDIQDVSKKLLSQFELEFLALRQSDIVKINNKSSNAYISYSFNNVIFVDYSVYIDVEFKKDVYYPNYKSHSIGYDLITGDKLSLDDMFKPGSDYKSKINSFISQYLIDNNYDDYEAERMTKPFQGIRENQSFAMAFEGLRIILDDKNDEFFNNGYTDQVLIPFKYLADDLYIFDKYFNENNNIYKQDKLSKKLLPNKLEFKASNIIQEDKPGYYIYITQGEFINVPDKNIEKKLNKMTALNYALEDFKDKAKEYAASGKNSQYGHHINVFMNSGGYLSMAVVDEIRFDTLYEFKREPFNYDFNKNREMLLSDIFEDDVNINNVIKTYIKKNMHYKITEEVLETAVKTAVESNMFSVDDYAIQIYFNPKGVDIKGFEEWIFIPLEEFGLQNIKLLN